MTVIRDLETPIREDLVSKMVFVAGPRQVGKTTLARRLLDGWETGAYLSWDHREDRREIRAARWPAGEALVVLDEIHKWRGWKGWLKGEFDAHRERLRFLVTGSARLDIYRRGGDSLQGRYHHYRLHPFTLREALGGETETSAVPFEEIAVPAKGDEDVLRTLLRLGGFPEPFLSGSERTLRRWQKERTDRFFREDVRDLETVRDLGSIQILADLLPERVGSLLSVNALREDIEVSHRAVDHWLEVLERLYYTFRLPPLVSPKVRALKKQKKAYLWDWGLVPEAGPRFENLVALHLLKLCHRLADQHGYAAELHYLRDRDGREVDFVVTVGRKPWFAVEAKVAETTVDPALVYFRDRIRIPWTYQITLDGTRDFVEKGIRVLPASRFLRALL